METARFPCSECRDPGGIPVCREDLDRPGDAAQVEGAAAAFGGGLAGLGLAFSRRLAARSLHGLAFCKTCRERPRPAKNPFLACKMLAVLGFLAGLSILGAPVAFLLFGAGTLLLRRRLRLFRRAPSAATLGHALDAAGTLAAGVISTLAVLLVLGGVVVYMIWIA